MRIYLDTCCYSRAFDNQTSERIILEADATLNIRDEIKNNHLELATSYMLHYENNQKKDRVIRDIIDNFLRTYKKVYIGIEFSKMLEQKVDVIMSTGVKNNDAFHIASAILSKSDYFITVDDRLLKYRTDEIKIVNPVEFVKILGAKDNVER